MINNLDYAMINGMNRIMGELSLSLGAVQAFNRAYARGRRRHILAKVIGRQDHLQVMTVTPVTSKRSTGRIVSVPIQQIKGTFGRFEDFDAAFNPLAERSRSRWVSLATASMAGIPLPPVELVKVGEAYGVIDGHHRISVARAMGQSVIEARILS